MAQLVSLSIYAFKQRLLLRDIRHVTSYLWRYLCSNTQHRKLKRGCQIKCIINDNNISIYINDANIYFKLQKIYV